MSGTAAPGASGASGASEAAENRLAANRPADPSHSSGSPASALRAEIEMLREAIAQVSRLAAGSNDLLETSRALQAISQGADRLSHLLKEQAQTQPGGETVETALRKALDELMQEMGIDENHPGS